ncbi:MAG TPA: methyltransferase domain-containing protein, partial [Rhizobiaceae bacterium]|nr:methyltransferase domain-containing protein [Rhizobiaceae bacterium]
MTVILHRAGRNRLSEEFRFLKTWIAHPRATGAIAPSGTAMARRMAAAIDPSSGLPVLELGPGTGAMTRAIVERGLPQAQLWSLEYEASFLAHLKRAFPQVNFIQGDAFDLANSLPADAPQAFDCVISSLPLLNFPVARRTVLICDLLS